MHGVAQTPRGNHGAVAFRGLELRALSEYVHLSVSGRLGQAAAGLMVAILGVLMLLILGLTGDVASGRQLGLSSSAGTVLSR